MIKDILRLKYSAALSHEAIARSLGISKGVVAKYLGLAGAAGQHSRVRQFALQIRSYFQQEQGLSVLF